MSQCRVRTWRVRGFPTPFGFFRPPATIFGCVDRPRMITDQGRYLQQTEALEGSGADAIVCGRIGLEKCDAFVDGSLTSGLWGVSREGLFGYCGKKSPSQPDCEGQHRDLSVSKDRNAHAKPLCSYLVPARPPSAHAISNRGVVQVRTNTDDKVPDTCLSSDWCILRVPPRSESVGLARMRPSPRNL